MTDAFDHNMRIFHVANADPLRSHLNQEYVDLLHGRTYNDMAEDVIRSLKIQQTMGTVRKDAVRGFEVLLTFSKEDVGKFSIDEWAKSNVEWLRKTFNPPGMEYTYQDAGTGRTIHKPVDNVKSVVLHMDENIPHLHAFIVPVDDHGRLNAKYYTGDRQKLIEVQNDYAKAMEPYGLKRGAKHSVATHEQTSAYYNKLLEPLQVELPKPLPGESTDEYRDRANETYRTQQIHHRDEILKVRQEAAHLRADAIDERKQLHDERAQFQAEQAGLERQVSRLASALGKDEISPDDIRQVRHAVVDKQRFEEAVQNNPDREKAGEAQRLYQDMINWQRERESLTHGKKKQQDR